MRWLKSKEHIIRCPKSVDGRMFLQNKRSFFHFCYLILLAFLIGVYILQFRYEY